DPATGAGGVLSTVSGPSSAKAPDDIGLQMEVTEGLLKKMVGQQELAQLMPANPNKASEYGDEARCPMMGFTQTPPSIEATSSTASEIIASEKVGDGKVEPSVNNMIEPLDRVRVDSNNQPITTNQGVPVANNQDRKSVV